MEMAAVGVETAAAVVTVASMGTITAVFVTEVCCGGIGCGGICSGSCSGSGGSADHYHQPYLIYSHSAAFVVMVTVVVVLVLLVVVVMVVADWWWWWWYWQ